MQQCTRGKIFAVSSWNQYQELTPMVTARLNVGLRGFLKLNELQHCFYPKAFYVL